MQVVHRGKTVRSNIFAHVDETFLIEMLFHLVNSTHVSTPRAIAHGFILILRCIEVLVQANVLNAWDRYLS